LQSFFLVFKRHVFTSDAFAEFIDSIQAEASKMDIIEKYEVGLSQVLTNNGHTCMALTQRELGFTNQSLECPFSIIEKGFPFLKVDLLRNNPLGAAQLYTYKTHVSPTLAKLIEQNLKRTAPDCKRYMHYKYQPWRKSILHPKLLKIQLKNHSGKTSIRINLLGVQILKLKLRLVDYRKPAAQLHTDEPNRS
jgi:lipopolysaccharide biosynthesis protein